MIKLKKMFYLFLIVILVVPILFLYNAFNGNPLSKYASKLALKQHLEETYPEEEFTIDGGTYDFKFSEYVFHVKRDHQDYTFNVAGFFQPTVTTDGFYQSQLDESLMERLGEEAGKELREVLKDIQEIMYIDVYVEVITGTYDESVTWRKDLPLEKPMDIFIILDGRNMKKEHLLQVMKQMQTVLNTEGYQYGTVTINANIRELTSAKDDFGYVKYASSFTKEQTITIKDIKELK